MAQPAKMALAEELVDRWKSCTLEHIGVKDFILPADAEDASETTKMETVKSSLLCCVGCPGFTGVEKCAQDTSSVHLHFGTDGEVVVGSYSVVELKQNC